jgi:hypothetical protein
MSNHIKVNVSDVLSSAKQRDCPAAESKRRRDEFPQKVVAFYLSLRFTFRRRMKNKIQM